MKTVSRVSRRNQSYFGRWWWTVDRGIFASILILIFIGAIMGFASSPAVAKRIGLDGQYFAYRQLFFLMLCLAVIVIISMLDVVTIRRLSVIGLLLALLLLMIVPFVGDEIKGARRWVRIAGVSIQPSEFMKPFFAVVSAWFFARRYITPGFAGYLLSTILYCFVIVLLLMQPDLGMVVTVTMMWVAQFFVAGLPVYAVMGLSMVGIVGLYAAYVFFPHVNKRIETFLNPEESDNYQVDKSLEAFQSGGITGVGPGEGTVKQFLPDSHTDFVFAVLGEEYGLFACLFVMSVFAYIVVKGFYRAMQEKDLFVSIAIVGLLTQFGVQSLINIGVSIHLLPTKGMTLPFLSYGGSSLLAIGIGMGMLLVLTRRRYGVL